jgi:UDP-glucose 6-dehydrogenase
MENCFLALKVTFCNEFFDIAEQFGVDYNELRELWLLDPRIGRSHTFVMPDDRGFGGKCLPKDVSALVQSACAAGYAPQLMLAMLEANSRFRGEQSAPALESAQSR